MITKGPEARLAPRMQQALNEVRALIVERYPMASFDIRRGHDEPRNVHLMAAVDLNDPFDVLDLVRDRLLELQIDERIPLYVIPLRTLEMNLALQAGTKAPRRELGRLGVH